MFGDYRYLLEFINNLEVIHTVTNTILWLASGGKMADNARVLTSREIRQNSAKLVITALQECLVMTITSPEKPCLDGWLDHDLTIIKTEMVRVKFGSHNSYYLYHPN